MAPEVLPKILGGPMSQGMTKNAWHVQMSVIEMDFSPSRVSGRALLSPVGHENLLPLLSLCEVACAPGRC